MQSNDPNNHKANPNYLLQVVSHLGVTAVLSDQPFPIIKRVERALQRIYAEVQAGRISAPHCLEAIGAQLAIVQGKPQTIEELLRAYYASRPLRNREDTDDYDPIDKAQRALLDECEAINREIWLSCEERVEKARRALDALDQSTIQIAKLGGVVDRRALPTGARIFISYAHEDKKIAQFIEHRLRNGGVSTWLDDARLAGGAVLPVEIAENIRNCSHFCVILSPASEKSGWVRHESSLALANEAEHGTPQVIPIFHHETRCPTYLADRRAISIDYEGDSISELWTAIGLPNRACWSLSEISKLLRRGKKLLEAVEWCGQADGWLTVHEETFEELEESEFYLTSLGLQRKGYDLIRFARTHEIRSDNSAYAAYSEEFYGFTNSYVAGAVLLRDLTDLIEEIVASIPSEKTIEGPADFEISVRV
jgi:TIR domain